MFWLSAYLALLLNSLACTLSQGQDLGQNRRRPDLLTGMLRRVQGMLQVRPQTDSRQQMAIPNTHSRLQAVVQNATTLLWCA